MTEKIMIGIDEAGCGCMAGDMFVSIVAFPEDLILPDVTDSKLMTDTQREEVVDSIWSHALFHKTLEASPLQIDNVGLWASWGSLVRQLADFAKDKCPGQKVILDGNKALDRDWVIPVVKAERKFLAVAAASVLSKYSQTCCMDTHHRDFPVYGFDKHRGYVTKAHLAALKEHGPCPIHRMSYKPVRLILAERGRSST